MTQRDDLPSEGHASGSSGGGPRRRASSSTSSAHGQAGPSTSRSSTTDVQPSSDPPLAPVNATSFYGSTGSGSRPPRRKPLQPVTPAAIEGVNSSSSSSSSNSKSSGRRKPSHETQHSSSPPKLISSEVEVLRDSQEVDSTGRRTKPQQPQQNHLPPPPLPPPPPPPPLGIDLDDDDNVFPASPVQDVMFEDFRASAAFPQPPTINRTPSSLLLNHDPLTISFVNLGPGSLPNSILGHSVHEGFHLGHVFGWQAGFAERLIDYDINTSFVCLPPTQPATRQASQSEASTSASPAPQSRSYSQALSTASQSSATSSTRPTDASSQSNVVNPTSSATTAQPPALASTPNRSEGNGFSNKLLVESRPHPQAYYNPSTHAWTVIAPWRQNPLKKREDTPATCYTRSGQSRKTHHYIRVPQSIDPKLILKQTESAGDAGPVESDVSGPPPLSSQLRLGGPSSGALPDPTDHHDPAWLAPDTPPHQRWDLFVCSGCRNAFAVSPENYVPSCLGSQLCEDFGKSRIEDVRSQSQEALSDEDIVRAALEYIWKVVRNVLYHNNTSMIPVAGATYKKRLGQSPAALAIFERCGLTAGQIEGRSVLVPPKSERLALLKLCRAFLEISLWLAHLSRTSPAGNGQTVKELVFLKDIEPAIERLTGSDIVERDHPTGDEFSNTYGFSVDYRILGVTPETSDSDIVHAYNWQIETHTDFGPYYLDSLKEIACVRGEKREALQLRLAMESSANRLSQSELKAAYARLGIQLVEREEEFFGLKTYEPVEEDQIMMAYEAAKAAVPLKQGTESDLKELKDTVWSLAKQYKSDLLSTILESEVAAKPSVPVLSLEESYSFLQASPDTADDMLCSAVNILYFTDTSTTEYQRDRAKAALKTIGEARNSTVIDQFLQTGMLPEAIETPREAPVSKDRPAGLQNIGNTCYLNSLLQYFFTIEQLRQVVLDFDRYKESRSPEEVAQLKKVGGRRVTQREIERSKKFTALLASLFRELIQSKVSSVRPERDLAYLALVSSKDEENIVSPLPRQGSGFQPLDAIAEASNSGMKVDDALEDGNVGAEASSGGLVAGQQVAGSPPATEAGSPSVLGKRTSEHFDDEQSSMNVDDQKASLAVDKSDNKATEGGKANAGVLIAQAADDGVVEILPEGEARSKTVEENSEAAPPLPPRRQSSATATAATNMMFGRQNDVSEAMDNVIFQIEVALDDSLIPKRVTPTLAGEPCSFVQSLFYGTAKQTLLVEGDIPSVRTKEEAFSYLFVDVAQEGKDLYEGLDSYFEASAVEIDGLKAKRQDVITQLPPILQVQLQRVQFDRSNSRIYKSNAYMPFPQTLHMGRYVSPEGRPTSFAEKQEQTGRLRNEIAKLQAKIQRLEQKDEEQTLPDLMSIIADSLKQLAQSDDSEGSDFANQLRQQLGSDDTDVLSMLEEHANAIQKDVVDARQRQDACRRELDSLWSDDVDNEYELSSVFIHMGAAGYGHYYLYQRALPEQPNRWLKFNDESVTDVDLSEVFADTTGSTANPYWLTYVRKSEIDQRIDAVCRRFTD